MMGEAGAPELILAELELWHTRPLAPTRRLSLGNLVLPVEPPPGLGGLLLAAVVANFRGQLDAELLPDVHRLIEQVGRGERVVQPRLRHRFQVDRHGLARSQHRLLGAPLVDGGTAEFFFAAGGAPLAMVLGAVYALERLNEVARAAIAPLLHTAVDWTGPVGPRLLAELAGTESVSLATLADPRAWALDVLGFPAGTVAPTKQEVVAQYRRAMRRAHPDHGGDPTVAAAVLRDLVEARRVLSR